MRLAHSRQGLVPCLSRRPLARIARIAVAFVAGLVAAAAAGSARPATGAATAPSDDAVLSRLTASDWDGLRQLGRGALPVMARLYERGDPARRTLIANGFYSLSWESPDAKRVLAADLGTTDRTLRLSVQYALGRVSGENDVVDALLRTMRTDSRQLFRDKAACALAYDQIHLTPQGKVLLFLGLIAALSDPKLQVRAIAIQALEVHTGQRKGFEPGATESQRALAIEEWRKWLHEYRAQL